MTDVCNERYYSQIKEVRKLDGTAAPDDLTHPNDDRDIKSNLKASRKNHRRISGSIPTESYGFE